jgi:hypothetical protein
MTMERRSFLITGARLLLLGGMTATAGYLLAKGKVGGMEADCRGCPKTKSCGAEQAIACRSGK